MSFTREQLRKGILWFASGITCLVLLLSLLNKVGLSQTFWRCAISFGVVYGLSMGSVLLFERFGQVSVTDEPNAEESSGATDNESQVGQLLDLVAGDMDEKLGKDGISQDADKPPAGQIKDVVNNSGIDLQHQADILRKMGWSTEEM